ncbi:MAG: class II fructose-bisphosphate aldolase [Anaerolineae bacterium]
MLPGPRAIRVLTSVHLVLHGGSGVPAAMIAGAVAIAGGGVSKVNIATDLELAALAALDRDDFMTNAEMNALPPDARTGAGGGQGRGRGQDYSTS